MTITQAFTDGPWTHFYDMHSGGSLKVKPFGHIFIQAPFNEAKSIFYARFERNPDRVTCTCCGADYSIDEATDLYQATAFERGCNYDSTQRKWVERSSGKSYSFHPYMTLDEYVAKSATTLFISRQEIRDDERTREVPRHGYVWVD